MMFTSCVKVNILDSSKRYVGYKPLLLSARRGVQLTKACNYYKSSALLMSHSISLPTHGSVPNSKLTIKNGNTPINNSYLNQSNKSDRKIDDGLEGNDLIKTLSEQLILETTMNLHKPTRAENQVDTLSMYRDLLTCFTPRQSKAIMSTILYFLNEQFYMHYNDKFLRDFEIDKQDHLFNSLKSEIQYTITNNRDTELNKHHLLLMRLKRDLDSIVDEINELIIDQYEKNCKLDFHEHKNENTLLYKRINLNLNDCSNKITIQITSGIKSEIETLRWQTTRSGLLAVVIMASSFMIVVNISNKKSRNSTTDILIEENSNKNKDEVNDDEIIDIEVI